MLKITTATCQERIPEQRREGREQPRACGMGTGSLDQRGPRGGGKKYGKTHIWKEELLSLGNEV